MKSKVMRLCAACLLVVQTAVIAQKTEIAVKRGRVIAETQGGTVAVDAGRRAVLTPDRNPVITVDDPMVDDLIDMYKWVEAEKQAARQHIEGATVFVGQIENEHLATVAALMEKPNIAAAPANVHRLENTSILEDPKFYDLQGNLLRFDSERISPQVANYTLYFANPVPPGEMFRYIVVSKMRDQMDLYKDGTLWYLRCNFVGANRLNYCRIILPASAAYVDSNWPVAIADSRDGRIAVTCRSYSGTTGYTRFAFAFLWPEKDGTTLADLPPKYRGLRDVWAPDVVKEAMASAGKILAGGTHNDQSTPLNTILTLFAALKRKDKPLFTALMYDRELKEAAGAQFDVIVALFGDSPDEFDLLGTPPWPEKPKNRDTFPLYLCRKGSQICEVTIGMVFMDDKWYLQGFQFGDDRAHDAGADEPKTSGGVTISTDKPDLGLATYQGLEPGKFMKDWLFLGPIRIPWNGPGYFPDDKTARTFFDKEMLPADRFQPKVAVGDTQYTWSLLKSEYGIIDLTGPFPDWYMVGFACAVINMPEDTEAVLGIGSDDSIKVWLNGRLVHDHWEKLGRGVLPDNDKVRVNFKKGPNLLVLKIQNSGGPWGFACRLLQD